MSSPAAVPAAGTARCLPGSPRLLRQGTAALCAAGALPVTFSSGVAHQ